MKNARYGLLPLLGAMLLVALAGSVAAQSLIDEDFEGVTNAPTAPGSATGLNIPSSGWTTDSQFTAARAGAASNTRAWSVGSQNFITNPSGAFGSQWMSFYWSPSVTNYSVAAITPSLDASSVSNLQLQFDLFNDGTATTAETFEVWYRDNTASTPTWVQAFTRTTAATATETNESFGLSPLVGVSDFQLAFVAQGDDSYDINVWMVDNIRLFSLAANDVGVTAITAPVTGPNLTATETVTVTIKNYGSATQTSIPVSFTVNGGTPVNETYTGSIAGGATDTYTFTGTADLSTPSTTYAMAATTSLSGDANSANDSNSSSVSHLVSITSFPYTEDFEGASAQDWVTSGTNAALWELGTPTAVGPASAHSGSKCWGTVINGDYGVNSAQAYLTSPVIDLTGTTQPVATFYHYVDSENSWDGGALQISVNGGTFATLADTDPGFTQNAPNDASVSGLSAGPGWTGTPTASAWAQVKVNLTALTSVTVGATDFIQVRFWFGSDSSTSSYPGWYIDDFEVYSPASDDVGVVSIDAPSTGPGLTASETVTVTIKNYGTATQTSIPVSYTVNGGTPVSETYTGSLAANATDTYTFTTTADLSTPATTYALAATTSLTGDANSANDSATKSVRNIGSITSFPYTEDFEGTGVLDWTTSGTNAALWELGTPTAVGPASAYSGSNCWGTVINGDYGVGYAQAYLTSPTIDLAGTAQPVATFYHYVDSENSWDGGALQISVNGGTFTTLADTDPGFTQNAPNDASVSGLSAGPGWTGTPTASAWAQVKVNLMALTSVTVGATDSIQIRFWFGSDASFNAYPGWYIDDFSVIDPPEIDVQRPAGIANSLGSGAGGPVTDSLGNIPIGGQTFVYTIANLAGTSLDLTGTPIVDAPAGQQSNCTVTVNTTATADPIPGGTDTTFSVTVTPGAGVFTFDLVIASNDPDEGTYTINVNGFGLTNAPAVANPATGSNFTGSVNGPFTYNVDPGTTLASADIELTDAENDTITVASITAPATVPTGITAPSVPTPAASHTLSWTGTAAATNPPGDYTWQVTFSDAVNGSNVTVDVTIHINDVAPTSIILNASGGDGSSGTPYTGSFVVGDTGATSIGLATITDSNTSQTVTLNGTPSQTSGPTGGTGFQFTLSAGILTVAPAGTLIAADAGVQVFDVVVTDGGANTSTTFAVSLTVAGVSTTMAFTNTSPLAGGTVGTVYGPVTMAVTGATGTVAFSIANGTSLPAGLTLSSSTGDITGTPTTPGTTTFDVRALDTTANEALTGTFQITINAAGGGSGGSGGGGGGGGGCSAGSTGGYGWLALLGLLSAFVVFTRVRGSKA